MSTVSICLRLSGQALYTAIDGKQVNPLRDFVGLG